MKNFLILFITGYVVMPIGAYVYRKFLGVEIPVTVYIAFVLSMIGIVMDGQEKIARMIVEAKGEESR